MWLSLTVVKMNALKSRLKYLYLLKLSKFQKGDQRRGLSSTNPWFNLGVWYSGRKQCFRCISVHFYNPQFISGSSHILRILLPLWNIRQHVIHRIALCMIYFHRFDEFLIKRVFFRASSYFSFIVFLTRT